MPGGLNFITTQIAYVLRKCSSNADANISHCGRGWARGGCLRLYVFAFVRVYICAYMFAYVREPVQQTKARQPINQEIPKSRNHTAVQQNIYNT